MNFFDELQFRGLVSDFTAVPESRADLLPLPARLAAKPITLYAGFDPTADSLHVGSLVPLIALRRFQNMGHHPIAVAGGATGSIGDPSGKTAERQLLTKEQIQANVDAVRPQLAKLLDFDSKTNPARLVDNADWFSPISYLDFLRDVGKHFTVNQMVAKESVRARMEDRDVGISYTEFSYMLLQAYDFYQLAATMDCELQIGGSDQWGNITAGIDLVRKKLGRHAYGFTMPLITKADGTKFGKTESGTIWLDPKKTDPIKEFYQFWLRTDDRDVVKYLKFFTFLSPDQIKEYEDEHLENAAARVAHHALAREVTTLIHGADIADQAYNYSRSAYVGSVKLKSKDELESLSAVNPLPIEITKLQKGIPLVEVLTLSGLSTSKSQARRDIDGGGIKLNGDTISTASLTLTADNLLHDRFLVLQKGKKNFAYFTVENQASNLDFEATDFYSTAPNNFKSGEQENSTEF